MGAFLLTKKQLLLSLFEESYVGLDFFPVEQCISAKKYKLNKKKLIVFSLGAKKVIPFGCFMVRTFK